MRGLSEDGPVRDGVVQPPHEDVGARIREVLEPGAGDRELTLLSTFGARGRTDICGLVYENECRHLCSNPPAYVVTSSAYPPRYRMTFLVCVDHAHLVRSMRWFESMRSLPRD